jgi:hypothetical protein
MKLRLSLIYQLPLYSDWIVSRTIGASVPQDTIAPGFSLWDAVVSQRIVRGFSAFVAVDNLTNSQDSIRDC